MAIPAIASKPENILPRLPGTLETFLLSGLKVQGMNESLKFPKLRKRTADGRLHISSILSRIFWQQKLHLCPDDGLFLPLRHCLMRLSIEMPQQLLAVGTSLLKTMQCVSIA